MFNIINRPVKNYHYQAQAKVDLLETVTNIGGLLGLYIGLSIVDLRDIAKTMLARMVTLLESITSVLFLRIFMIKSKKVMKKIFLYLRKLKRLPLRNIINLITTPILLIQLFYLVYEYLQYPTQFSTEFPSLEKNSSDINSRLISSKEYPDITLCHRISFLEAFRNKSSDILITEAINLMDDFNVSSIDYDQAITLYKKHLSIIDLKNIFRYRVEIFIILPMLKTKWLRIWFTYYLYEIYNQILTTAHDSEVLTEYFQFALEFMIKYIVANSLDDYRMRMEPITNIDEYGLNGTFDMFRFFNTIRHIKTRIGSQWVKLNQTNMSLMKYGMCTKQSAALQLINQYIDRLINIPIFGSSLFQYTMILHPYGTIPVPHLNVFQFENSRDEMIILKKYTLEKLPSPYDTNCQQYEQGNQHQCLNDCYTKKYLNRFTCIPTKPKHMC